MITTPTRGTRRLRPLLTALALLAAACGDGTDDTDPASEESGAEPAADAGDATDDTAEGSAFPVTIGHKYGETVIEAEPTRVVSVGFNDQDHLLALGVVPVGIRDWYGDQPFATWPWAIEALGDAEPEVLSATEIEFEAVAALDPDLIVGISSGMTAEEYELLSRIAPTLAQSDAHVDYGVPWQEETLVIGEAVGRAEEAAGLVADIEARFAEIRDEHPEFEGAEAAVSFWFDGQPGAYASSDLRSRIMTDLGFAIPAAYDEIAGDGFFASISEEEIGLLDVDVVVWMGGTEADMATITGSPVRSGLTAAAEGRELFLSVELAGAFSFGSPLSLNHLLDELVPQLEAAIDGDPATAVPSAGETTAGGEGGAGAGGADDGAEQPEEEVASPEGQAAMDAWALVFDSAATFGDKSAHLEDASALEVSNSAYADTGTRMGGVALAPTGVVLDGDTATVTYDVLFGGNAAYTDLTGTITLVDGVWTVSREEYCGFLASARTPCED